MKLFKYALLLVVLMGFVSIAYASVSTTLTGTTTGSGSNPTYITGYDVTCTATSTKTTGNYMIFNWDKGGPTLKTMTISKNAGKYVCTLRASDFQLSGEWHLSCQEYSSLDPKSILNGQLGQKEFTAEAGGSVTGLSVIPTTCEYGESVTATATVTGTTPVTFRWYRPDDLTNPIRVYTVSTPDSSSHYIDSYSNANVAGIWKVTATQSISTPPGTTFTVSPDESDENIIFINGDISPVGSYILTENITATAISSDYDTDGDEGVTMKFDWYSPSSTENHPFRSYTVDKRSNNTYFSTLPGGTSTEAGLWYVRVYEYDDTGSEISSGVEEFNTEESYSISGTQIGSDFVTGYDVTCSIYSPDIGGSYMIFKWYNDANTLVKTVTIYENDYYFICTLPASYFNTQGDWRIEGEEFDSEGKSMDIIHPQFTAVNAGSVTDLSLSGTPDTSSYGATITATAEATTDLPVTFRWYRPDDLTNPIRVYTVSTPSSGSSYFYSDSYNDADVVGSWTVTATQGIASPSSESFTINGPSSGYTYLITGVKSASGAFIINETVTAAVTSPYTNAGGYMKFYWYSPSDKEARFNTVYKIDGKYTDTLSDIQFDSIGSWHVHVYEYNNTDNLIGGGSQEEFEATDEGVPEFPIIGSFLPMLLAGAVYIRIRRNMEGS
ncbi:hypothetical protein [uncultured Methanomethylovorans sp.]|uniref:hypothetical protein n=1 Tax=uncultured Methanomethylovorans sp. TaxID=183759 RepID=UPI002AA8CB6F|nr:hypothetical protein [uncultured Methanomethylovorans sp.]